MRNLVYSIAFALSIITGGKACLQFVATVPATKTASAAITETAILSPASTTGSFASPYSETVHTAVPSGEYVTMFISANSDTDPAFTVKDSEGNCSNVYTKEKFESSSGDNASVSEYDCKITTGLTTSDHFTLTATNDGDFVFTGVAIANVTTFDNVVGTVLSNVSSLATGTYTPGVAAEGVCAEFATTATSFSSYGNIIGNAATGIGNASSGSRIGIVECLTIAATTPGTGTATVSNTADGVALILGYH